ncbi:MAG: HAD family hydrolase [Sedimentisphaerales bacterium]|nr:HAD family hydrolase [Sedimentisphaerales bacterium]
MQKIIMFDFDGVIVDSLEIFRSNFTAVCKKSGHQQFSDNDRFLDLLNGNFYEEIANSGIPLEIISDIYKNLELGIDQTGPKMRFFDGITDMLNILTQNHTLIIITSNSTPVVENFFADNHITSITEILGADKETSKVKKIQSQIRRFPNAEYYYIGDTLGDMIEGQKAGARTIAVSWGWHSVEKLSTANPYKIVYTTKELTDFLNNNHCSCNQSPKYCDG